MRKIRNLLVALLYISFSLILQSVLVGMGLPLWLIPDLVVLLILFIGFYEVSFTGLFMAFFAGLIVDISGGIYVGPWAGAYVLAFGGLALIAEHVFAESKLSLYPITFTFVVLTHILFLLPAFDPLGQISTDWFRLLGKAFVTALLAPIVFKLFNIILSPAKVEMRRAGYSRRK